MQQKPSSKMAYILAALMLSTAIIYFVAAVEESAESAGDVSEQATSTPVKDRDFDSDEVPSATTTSNVADQDANGGDTLATQVQTVFFAIVGVGYAAIGAWMLKDKGRTNAPYIIAAAGSISIIGLYVASRTIDLPIVGLQDDIGTIDILSKVLQVGIIVLAAYIMNSKKTLMAAPSKRQQTK